MLNPELCLIEQQSAANRCTVWMCVWLGECKNCTVKCFEWSSRLEKCVKKGSKEATSLQEKHQGQTDLLQKVIFSKESPFRLFGASGKNLVRRRKCERYHQSCVMPTVKHPETIHVWGCFSAKGVGSLIILPKNTAMNKEWYQNILREQLLLVTNNAFSSTMEHLAIRQKWQLSGSGKKTLKFWVHGQETPQTLIHWELVVNPQEARGQTKTHKFWQSPSIDNARMGCHQSACGPEVN